MALEDATDAGEELVARVAAIDIAKASAMVCTRSPHPSREGRRVQHVWAVGATTKAVLELGARLVEEGVERVVMEATGVYWKPFFYLLEGCGLECWLVNARDVKNVPGRPKTDRLDAVWLAKLTERGMLRPSFVPPRAVRELRDLTRTRAVFVRDRTRDKQRTEKVLEDAQIKVSSVISDIYGLSGRAILDALAAGEHDPWILAEKVHSSMAAKKPAIREALEGSFTSHHAYLLGVLLQTVDYLTGQIDALTARIEQQLAAMPAQGASRDDSGPGTGEEPGAPTEDPGCRQSGLLPLAGRLDEIPGVGPKVAQVILAEIGTDMSVFPTAEHLASWAKFCPRSVQSGPRSSSGRTGKGNGWLRGALGEAAAAAAKTDTFLGARYRRLVKRIGKQKALVAVARSILVIAWHLIRDPAARYQDLGPDWHQRMTDPVRKTHSLVRQLEALGHQVALTTPAP
ncbi:IS110 family transposase [Streptomyces sp. NPDC005799]|uniref:IS110 family transposase n=1 Tax=Streptomyces sp. NPDC005799 TaxID=3154678 RepID=UPI0033C60AF4